MPQPVRKSEKSLKKVTDAAPQHLTTEKHLSSSVLLGAFAVMRDAASPAPCLSVDMSGVAAGSPLLDIQEVIRCSRTHVALKSTEPVAAGYAGCAEAIDALRAGPVRTFAHKAALVGSVEYLRSSGVTIWSGMPFVVDFRDLLSGRDFD